MNGTDNAQFSLALPNATLPSFISTSHFSLNSVSAILLTSSLNSLNISKNLCCIFSGVSFNSLINLSTLFMKRTGFTLSLNACLITVSVCGIIPSTAHTRTIVPSIALIALVTFPPKSTCPGVSIKLIKYSFPWKS